MSWYIVTKEDLRTGQATAFYKWEDEDGGGLGSITLTDDMVTELISCLVASGDEEPEEEEMAEQPSPVFDRQIDEAEEKPRDDQPRTLRELMGNAGSEVKTIEDEDGVQQG
jgi:hypothetical protein